MEDGLGELTRERAQTLLDELAGPCELSLAALGRRLRCVILLDKASKSESAAKELPGLHGDTWNKYVALLKQYSALLCDDEVVCGAEAAEVRALLGAIASDLTACAADGLQLLTASESISVEKDGKMLKLLFFLCQRLSASVALTGSCIAASLRHRAVLALCCFRGALASTGGAAGELTALCGKTEDLLVKAASGSPPSLGTLLAAASRLAYANDDPLASGRMGGAALLGLVLAQALVLERSACDVCWDLAVASVDAACACLSSTAVQRVLGVTDHALLAALFRVGAAVSALSRNPRTAHSLQAVLISRAVLRSNCFYAHLLLVYALSLDAHTRGALLLALSRAAETLISSNSDAAEGALLLVRRMLVGLDDSARASMLRALLAPAVSARSLERVARALPPSLCTGGEAEAELGQATKQRLAAAAYSSTCAPADLGPALLLLRLTPAPAVAPPLLMARLVGAANALALYLEGAARALGDVAHTGSKRSAAGEPRLAEDFVRRLVVVGEACVLSLVQADESALLRCAAALALLCTQLCRYREASVEQPTLFLAGACLDLLAQAADRMTSAGLERARESLHGLIAAHDSLDKTQLWRWRLLSLVTAGARSFGGKVPQQLRASLPSLLPAHALGLVQAHAKGRTYSCVSGALVPLRPKRVEELCAALQQPC